VIEIHGENGKIGEVSLKGGKVAGSTPALHHVAAHMLRKHGTPQKAFRKMATMNNGYVWAQKPPGIPAAAQFAATWDDVAGVIGMSAETGRLASTPAPYGKPGGPGLYGVKGLKHSDYLEQVVQALMRKGMDKGKATAIARGSIRKWMAKSKHPEVRAAAGLAETQEIAAQARAHAHANTWDEVAGVVDLAAVVRVPAGQAGGGQFGSGGATAAPASAGKPPAAGKKPLTAQQQAAQQQQKAKASATAKATAAATMAKDRQAKKVQTALTQAAKPPAPDPHQQHVAHVQELQKQAALKMQEKSAAKEAEGDKSEGGGQTSRQGLLATASADRKKANALIAQRKVLQGELASAGGATSSGQSGSTTSAGASTTASTAPAVAATPAAATPAATTPSTTAASSSTASKPTAAQLTTAIAGLTSQITSLLKSAAAAQAQAAKMGSAPAGKTAGPPAAAK
jgi:trimeric autotransporter adhesin